MTICAKVSAADRVARHLMYYQNKYNSLEMNITIKDQSIINIL